MQTMNLIFKMIFYPVSLQMEIQIENDMVYPRMAS